MVTEQQPEDNEPSESFVDRFRPETWSDIQGNNKSLKAIKEWCENWTEGDTPILLYGVPGTGKTSTAYVAADHMGWHLNQVNASDDRTSDGVAAIANAMRSSPYDGTQLVLLDEIDSFHHSADLSPLKAALRNPKFPVIMTANDPYSIPGGLRRLAQEFEFKLGVRSRKAKIRKVAKEIDLDISAQQIEDLGERPDLRSAINDLQILAETGSFSEEDDREWGQSEFDAVDSLVRGEPINISAAPNEIIWWLDENWRSNGSDMGKNIRGLEVGIAYDTFSRADVCLERAKKDDYRSWKYADALLEASAEVRLTETFGYLDKSYPERFRMSSPKSEGDSPEARVYRKLSGKETGRYGFSGSYTHFRKVLLPLIKRASVEERRDMALTVGLRDDELAVIGLDETEYSGWATSEPTRSDSGGDALQW